MLFVNVFLEPTFGAEYQGTFFTFIPVAVFLVFQAKLAVMGGPSSEAPVAFNFVCMGVAVVEMLPEAFCLKRPTTALIHFGCFMKLLL